MRGRLLSSVVVLALLSSAGLPASADDLGSHRQELSEARTDLDDLERLVQRTRDEVAAAEAELREAATERAAVRDRLRDAEAAMAAADARERASARALAAADGRLDARLSGFEQRREALDARAVSAYKRGPGVAGDVLVRGVTGADDWHEVAVTLETVQRLADRDRRLVSETAAATRRAADARGAVAATRSEAVDARQEAARRRREVEQLLARHEATVARIEEESARRAAALEALESDAAATAVLVDELEQRVARLERAPLAAVTAPVDVDLSELGPPPAWAGRLPEGGRRWAAAVEGAATAHGIDGRLLAALVWTESGFVPGAVSPAGAVGLAQLMPGTARGLGVDPHDPLQNLAGGAAYLRGQLRAFGRVDLALAAYNAGPGRVSAAGRRVPDIVETQLYVVRVLERYERLAGERGG